MPNCRGGSDLLYGSLIPLFWLSKLAVCLSKGKILHPNSQVHFKSLLLSFDQHPIETSHTAKLIINSLKAIFLPKRYGHWAVREHLLINNLSHQFWSYSNTLTDTFFIRHIQIILNKYLLDTNCVFNLLFLELSPLCRFCDKNSVTISLDFLPGGLNVHN